MRERLALRETLEVMAMMEASRRIGPSQREELDRRLKRLSAAVAANAYYEAGRADLEFHRYIWECSGNRILARTLTHIATPLFAFASMLRSTSAQDLSQATNAHVPLVRALQSCDPSRIKKAVSVHLANSYDKFLVSGAEDCRSYAQPRRAVRVASIG